MNTLMNAYANGTINTCRFVVPDTTHPNAATQAADGTHLPLGIAGNAGRLRPDPDLSDANVLVHAIAGETCRINPPGNVSVDLYCNFAWAPGDLLMADASGKGIVATTGKYYGARAESAGVVDALCPVTVITGLLP